MKKICPLGKIERKGYTTKKGTKVLSTCVKDMRPPGKTPLNKKVLPKLKEGYLGKYGYSLSNSSTKREESLLKAMKKEGELEVLRHVVVLRTYMKNEPLKFNKLDKDVKFIQKIRDKTKIKSLLKKTKSKTKIKKKVRFRK